ncbi:MAG: prepilin-type N-terminal cleavage/methylation domain-containing protein [Gammaproteobacteria bacterium]
MVKLNQSGFTLLETLVALSVLAISLGVIYQIFGTSLRNMQYTKEYSYAQMLAESKLSELGKGIPVKEGRYQGNFDQKYTWELNVEPIASISKNELIAKFRIDFVVLWDSSRGQRSVEITTHRLTTGGA